MALFTKMAENVAKFYATFDAREWAIIGTLLVSNFVNTIAFNCMDAFYPKEAHNRDIGTGDIGIIIGTYQLSRFIMAPFAGKYITNVGPTLAFFLGIFITAATAFGFGLLTLLPNGPAFFWASLAIRVLQALARTCFVVSSLTISAQLFPEHISLLGGLLETFAGFGYISGPVIGSALFELGGFILPNFTMGLLMALTGLAFACSTTLSCKQQKKKISRMSSMASIRSSRRNTLKLQHCSTGDLENPYIDEDSEDSASENCSKMSIEEGSGSSAHSKGPIKKEKKAKFGFMSVLKYGDTWLIMAVITLRGITCSFYQAPLPEHLMQLSSSALLVGAVYTVMSISYFLSAPVWGILVEKLKKHQPATLITLAGCLLAICSTLLLGPFPLLSIQKSIPLVSISFAILGFSAAALYIPVFQQCADISKKESADEDSTRVYACLFGLVQSSSTLGSFAGNILGGFGAQKVGFAWTCSLVALGHSIFAILLAFYALFRR